MYADFREIEAYPMASTELQKILSSSKLNDRSVLEAIAKDPVSPLRQEAATTLANPDALTTVSRHVVSSRMRELVRTAGTGTPKPLEQSIFSEVAMNTFGLVPLSAFQPIGGGLKIGGFIYEMLPSLLAKNSCYWLLQKLNFLSLTHDVKVRLDPFMCSDANGYSATLLKMEVFGPSLSWTDLSILSDEVEMRWMPDQPDLSEVIFTDVVWSPRADELHLKIEEVPKSSVCAFRPSRYFHAIFDKASGKVVHCDGANRIFEESECEERTKMHVSKVGKIGVRVKLFQIDEEIAREDVLDLVSRFFVWNDDATKLVPTC